MFPVSTVFFNDFGRYFYVFFWPPLGPLGHSLNTIGSAEPQLNTIALTTARFVQTCTQKSRAVTVIRLS